MNARGPPRVGLFGNIGSPNLGNEGSLDAVLDWLKRDHHDAIVDFMCIGPEKVKARYGVPAIPLNWYQRHEAGLWPEGHRVQGPG